MSARTPVQLSTATEYELRVPGGNGTYRPSRTDAPTFTLGARTPRPGRKPGLVGNDFTGFHDTGDSVHLNWAHGKQKG
jgi:hypothetical protein